VIKKFKAEALVLDENRFVERRVSKVHGFGLFAKMQIRKEDLRLPYLVEKITAIERDLRGKFKVYIYIYIYCEIRLSNYIYFLLNLFTDSPKPGKFNYLPIKNLNKSLLIYHSWSK